MIGQDRYFKRDDVGIIYQLNVAPGKRRGLIGAHLLQAQFERSAYGCRLYCCWCAQDIEANRFWEAMGFVPLAFRAGGERRGKIGGPRVHIFWQKRIRLGDEGAGATPWWFPSQTSGGSIREDRIVMPIPHGMHWSDEMPVLLPPEAPLPVEDQKKSRSKVNHVKKPLMRRRNGLSCDIPRQGETLPEAKAQKPPKPPRVKTKNDTRLVAAARELRDRWVEEIGREPGRIVSGAKYEVARALAPKVEAKRLAA